MTTHNTPGGTLHVEVPGWCSADVGDVEAACRAHDPVLDAALADGFELLAPVTIERETGYRELREAPSEPGLIEEVTDAAGADRRAHLALRPTQGRDAVVLLARENVYTWHFPTAVDDGSGEAETPGGPGGQGGVAAVDPPTGQALATATPADPAPVGDEPADTGRVLRFDIDLPEPAAPGLAVGLTQPAGSLDSSAPVALPAPPAQAWLLGFPRVQMAGLAIGALEAATVRTGLRRIKPGVPTLWRPVRCFFPPRRRPAKILLFFHGTFSSTVTSFGTLGVTEHGRRFLGRADDRYDLVVGYDHRSLSTDPTVNAADALSRLQRLGFPRTPEIDVVGFSRGGLVARAFVEEAIPASPWAGAIRKLVLVGAPNDGSPMADPQHWKDLVDRHTTLGVAAAQRLPDRVSRAIVAETIKGVGVLAKLLSSQGPTLDEVPGLAAMVPNSAFLQRLNGTGPGQPTPGKPPMYVMGADFEPQANLASPLSLPAYPVLWMLDQGADKQLPGPNDLIVAVSSTGAIDVPPGTLSPLVVDRLEVPVSEGVYHFTYFDSEVVVQRIADWLE